MATLPPQTSFEFRFVINAAPRSRRRSTNSRRSAVRGLRRAAVGAAIGEKFAEDRGVLRDQRDLRLALERLLRLENLEQRLQNIGGRRDQLQRLADDLGTQGRGLGERDRGGALGGAGDDVDLV